MSIFVNKEDLPYRRIFAAIDLEAFRTNLESIRGILPKGTKLCAVVKADAYGHGVKGLLGSLSGYADAYAVATEEEGALLRREGVTAPILVLGALQREEYRRAICCGLTVAISSLREAEGLSQEAETLYGTAHVHIAVETGMNRIGMRMEGEGFEELRKIAALPGISIDGCFTHFARADEADAVMTGRQLGRFQDFLQRAKEAGIHTGVRHCSNSAAILEGEGTDFDMVRAGIAMYGIYPSDEVRMETPLEPVMQLKSYLTFVKEIEAGETVSYGGIYRAERRTRVGTISAGYADGYPRPAAEGGMEVLIRGRRCPIIGRICMDQMMVDLSDLPEAEPGDLVTLFGKDGEEEISLNELSEKSGRYHYEILCGITGRVPRVYFDGGRAGILPD